jgi:LPXTG-motif cell wall-anchored protein
MKLNKLNIIVLLLLFLFPTKVALAESDGGSVQSNGEVSFYLKENALPNTEGTTAETASGLFPHTGEIVGKAFFISGVTLVLFSLFFFLWKRRKEEEEEEGRSEK